MPANTSPDNIQFPTAGDQIAPLNTVFQNLAQTTQTALTRRVVANVADFTALAALSTTGKLAGDLAFVVEGEVYMSWTGTVWRQATTAIFATVAARDTAYAKAGAAFRVARVSALEASTGIKWTWSGSGWRSDDGIYFDFVPVWPNITIGNASINQGRVSRIGNTINFYARLRLGTTSVMGTNPLLEFPFTAANPGSTGMFQVEMFNDLDNWYAGFAFASGPHIAMTAFGTASAFMQPVSITATVPFVWNNGDWIKVSGTYEAVA